MAMTTGMSTGDAHRLQFLPATQLGQWALRLAVASVVLLFTAPLINLIPGEVGNIAIFLTFSLALPAALAGGILALMAIFRDHDRSITVFLATAPVLMYVVLTVVEIIVAGEH